MSWLLVAAGAAVGAPLRYLVDRAVQARHTTAFPWGTFAVNAAGSLLLGLVTGAVAAGAAPELGLLLGGPGHGLMSTSGRRRRARGVVPMSRNSRWCRETSRHKREFLDIDVTGGTCGER